MSNTQCNKDIGNAIKRQLKELGMTQRQFAEKVFMSYSHLCNLLNDRTNDHIKTNYRLKAMKKFIDNSYPTPVEQPEQPSHDPVNHPSHYTSHPSGVECITITQHMGFCLGNAIKYIWRADLKQDALEDLKKAAFYINQEIKKRS